MAEMTDEECAIAVCAVVDYNWGKVQKKMAQGLDFDTALNQRLAEIIAEAAEAIGE